MSPWAKQTVQQMVNSRATVICGECEKFVTKYTILHNGYLLCLECQRKQAAMIPGEIKAFAIKP